MKIYFANDHAATKLKFELINHYKDKYECINLGCDNEESVDYPDYGYALAKALEKDSDAIGIIICGSGIGISIAANRFAHIRAALCVNAEYAKLAREHNNANVLAIGARFCDFNEAVLMMDTFLSTSFAGGRHEHRVQKLGQF